MALSVATILGRIIRRVWRDLFDLSYRDWGMKYVMPFMIVFCVWAALGSISEMYLEKEDLLHIQGKIVALENVVTRVVDKPFDKRTERELHIVVDTCPEYFRLTDQYDYQAIVRRLKPGETVDIYYRSTLRSILGMGKQRDVYQLESRSQIYFDLSNRTSNSVGVVIVSVLGFMVFSLLYLVWWGERLGNLHEEGSNSRSIDTAGATSPSGATEEVRDTAGNRIR